MADRCTLAEAAFDPAAELRAMDHGDGTVGALASFTGIARGHSQAGETVTGLFLDHHPRLTLQSMQDIANAAEARFEISNLRIIHRCGMVPAGEPIVFVAATSSHRRAALNAVNYMMDRLKTDAIFWKREDAADGGEWIEPTDADHAARAAWDGAS